MEHLQTKIETYKIPSTPDTQVPLIDTIKFGFSNIVTQVGLDIKIDAFKQTLDLLSNLISSLELINIEQYEAGLETEKQALLDLLAEDGITSWDFVEWIETHLEDPLADPELVYEAADTVFLGVLPFFSGKSFMSEIDIDTLHSETDDNNY